jgi:hypothetical protein
MTEGTMQGIVAAVFFGVVIVVIALCVTAVEIIRIRRK